MKNSFRKSYFVLITLTFIQLFSFSSFGQDFKKIVPLESTCNDVKAALSVEKCNFPQSVYRLRDFTIVVQFTEEKPSANDKICYKVPPKTVSSFTITYNKSIQIKDFGYELKLLGDINNDISTVAYENKEKGITVLSNNGIIEEVLYGPTLENYRKYSYPCSREKVKSDDCSF
jgi:hypothetical protein